MPVTLLPIGDTLNVSVHDTNFKTLQDLMRSGLVRADFAQLFDRYHILRYTGGKLVSATQQRRAPLAQELFNDGVIENLARYGSKKSSYHGPLDVGDYSVFCMELLGRPGPSLYYQWQEDGFTEAFVNGLGLAGWPPKDWPYTRYPEQLCYSPWLTIPGAALKAYVDEPCVARVTASALGGLNFSPVGIKTNTITGSPFGYLSIDQEVNMREEYPIRTALFVDTNPKLSDEFLNSNANILDPKTGLPSTYCSWRQIEEHTFYAAQRQQFKLCGEVELVGRKFYNFSFKFRDGGIRGARIDDGAGVPTWWNDRWPFAAAFGNTPTPNATYMALRNAALPVGEYHSATMLVGAIDSMPQLPFFNLWENASVHVEFFYNRKEAYRSSNQSPDFYGKP